MGRNSSRKQLRRSGRGGRLDGTSGEESVRFEAKKPEQDSGFDDLSETKYGKKQEKLSQLGLKAIEIQEIEDQLDGELDAMLDVPEAYAAVVASGSEDATVGRVRLEDIDGLRRGACRLERVHEARLRRRCRRQRRAGRGRAACATAARSAVRPSCPRAHTRRMAPPLPRRSSSQSTAGRHRRPSAPRPSRPARPTPRASSAGPRSRPAARHRGGDQAAARR